MEVTERNIESFLLEEASPSAFYIPNYVTAEDEMQLMANVYNAPKPKWTQLSARRLQNWGGLPHPKGMVTEAMPKWLQEEMDRVDALNIFEGKKTNHVLVNEYAPGQGIMPHVDGPLFHPCIATITLGSHAILDFYKERENESASSSMSDRHCSSLLLERRSLVVLRDDLYKQYLHGIRDVDVDTIHERILNLKQCRNSYDVGDQLPRATRISFTFRHVPKVLKVQLNFLKK